MKRMIWAIDAFGSGTTDKKVLKTLEYLAHGQSITVEPVYVSGPIQASVMAAGSRDFLESARARLAARFKKTNGKGPQSKAQMKVLPPKIIRQDSYSLTGASKALIAHAKKTKASTICVSSHARRGIMRALMGSFAETLFLHSPVPVLLINPSSVPKPIKTVFFPTDFSPESKKAFTQAVNVARANRAKLVLFNHINFADRSIVDTLYPEGTYKKYLKKVAERAKAKATGWANSAKGVRVETIISTKLVETPLEAVRQAKVVKASLIVMASKSGPLATHILGSLTRQIARESPCPLWVVHPVVKSTSAKRSPETVLYSI